MQTNKVKKHELPNEVTATPAVSAEQGNSHASCSTSNNESETVHYILFERIFSEMVHPKLPNGSWAIHRSTLPNKTIVVSQIGNVTAEVPPLYIKQIVFDQKLNFEVFFVNTRTVLKEKPGVPQTLEEFEQIVASISEIRLCAGGPAVIEYSNIDLECAYKDPMERWRHNLCSLETDDDSVCKSCFSLEEILQKSLQRNKLSGKSVNNTRKRKRWIQKKGGSRKAKRV